MNKLLSLCSVSQHTLSLSLSLSLSQLRHGSPGGEGARGDTTPGVATGAVQADSGGFGKRKSSQFLFTGPRKCPFCARVFASQHAVDIHSYRNAACRARFKVDEAPKDGRSRADSRLSAPSSEELPTKRSALSKPSHPIRGNNHSAKAPPPTHVLGCQCLALQHWRRQAVQSFGLLFSPTAPLWHPQLLKTCSKRAFPRPRAHMHTHGASERAATHTCAARKQASHLPDILCGLTRTRDHHSA